MLGRKNDWSTLTNITGTQNFWDVDCPVCDTSFSGCVGKCEHFQCPKCGTKYEQYRKYHAWLEGPFQSSCA